MQCFKCGKATNREDGGATIEGIRVTVKLDNKTPEDIAYNNTQLGKYSSGNGECEVCICYECYIDGLFK